MNLKTSSLLLALVIVVTGGFFYSCTKETVTTPTTTDSLTKLQILTQKTWRVDQLIHVISGQYSTYTLGGTNTTGIKYDNMRFTFKTDGTGTTTDENGNTVTTTWQFTTTDQRTMKLTVNLSSPIVFTWNMVEIVGNYLHATAGPLTVSGNTNNMESFRLIQIQ